MEFKKLPYYDKKFLGKHLYEKITDNDKILTVQEFFNINNVQNEYHRKDKYIDYKLKIHSDYYELDSQSSDVYLYIVFDKSVHIVGKESIGIIAPEIVVENNKNYFLSYCVTNKILINNGYENNYEIYNSKIHNVYFYNQKIFLNDSEINNFFILNNRLCFKKDSYFLSNYKIKCFGPCRDLKKKLLNNDEFRKGIIHIE